MHRAEYHFARTRVGSCLPDLKNADVVGSIGRRSQRRHAPPLLAPPPPVPPVEGFGRIQLSNHSEDITLEGTQRMSSGSENPVQGADGLLTGSQILDPYILLRTVRE